MGSTLRNHSTSFLISSCIRYHCRRQINISYSKLWIEIQEMRPGWFWPIGHQTEWELELNEIRKNGTNFVSAFLKILFSIRNCFCSHKLLTFWNRIVCGIQKRFNGPFEPDLTHGGSQLALVSVVDTIDFSFSNP